MELTPQAILSALSGFLLTTNVFLIKRMLSQVEQDQESLRNLEIDVAVMKRTCPHCSGQLPAKTRTKKHSLSD